MTETGHSRGLIRRLRPVRARITLAATVVTALAVMASGWLLIRSIEGTQLAQLRREADAEIDQIAEALATGDEQRFDGFASEIAILQIADGETQVLVDSTGGFRLGTDVDDAVAHGVDVPAPDAVQLDADGIDLVPPNIDVDDEPAVHDGDQSDPFRGPVDQLEHELIENAPSGQYEAVARRVDTPSGEEVTLTGIVPVDEVARSVDAVRRSLLLGLPAVVGLVGLSTWWLVGRALRPVEAIRAEAESIGGSTIHRRVPEPPTDDEIGRLARTMNSMLDRLGRSARRQRQFVSDASHELRSPVAAIRADLEVALHEGDRADWPSVAHDVLAEEARLERLLGELLILAADDEQAAGVEKPHPVPVDMAAVVAEEAARSREGPVTVTVTTASPNEPAEVRGSRSHLTRLVSNLLDNAARHAHRQVKVSVTSVRATAQEPVRVRLIVDDDGPGIEPADRERIFDRFVRLDESRARHEGGAGLGLAVVRSITQRHAGRVWVEESPDGGARFVIELPAA